MCGIIGSVGTVFNQKEALTSLDHRGPDSQGEQYLKVGRKALWIAHTRLAILDLSAAGQQPMRSRSGRWWVTYNGEIYNHLDLRHGLPGPFRGHSDTETLVELLAAQGLDRTLPMLNGMFGFAALDTLEGKLYLVRDPYGIKPLYYVQAGETFSFASEIHAVRILSSAGQSIDPTALQSFLTLRFVPSPDTLSLGVKRLPPGHILSLDIHTNQIQSRRYVSAELTKFDGSMNDAIEVYRDTLKAAVQRQLLSDVPMGILLSGGIDSALIAAMAKELGHEIPCFTVGFGEGSPECEIKDAMETAQVLGLPFHSVVVTPEQLQNALSGISRSIEEALGTTSVMPMWHLVERARQDVTVVLTGQGTDEPWGGYRRYQVEMVRRLIPWNGFWKGIKSVSNNFPRIPEMLERGLRTLSEYDTTARTLEACSLFSPTERESLTGDRGDGGAYKIMDYWQDWMANTGIEAAEKMMRMDMRMNLADDLLLYGDKISMAFSLEARVPMLDHELVRFVESLPLSYRVAFRRTKIAHKLMAERYLPSSIIHRKKKGFEVPFNAWSKGPWRQFVEHTLLSDDAPHFSMLRRPGVDRLWKEHLAGKPGRGRQIFALLMLALLWRVR